VDPHAFEELQKKNKFLERQIEEMKITWKQYMDLVVDTQLSATLPEKTSQVKIVKPVPVRRDSFFDKLLNRTHESDAYAKEIEMDPSGPAIKRGKLAKKPKGLLKINDKWKIRTFVLREHSLSYYETADGGLYRWKGAIQLTKNTLVETVDFQDTKYGFKVTTAGDICRLRADNSTETTEWMTAIRAVVSALSSSQLQAPPSLSTPRSKMTSISENARPSSSSSFSSNGRQTSNTLTSPPVSPKTRERMLKGGESMLRSKLTNLNESPEKRT